MGAMASGGAAALGTGAFSRVESERSVTIQAAEDADAYLGLDEGDTNWADNYVELDSNGHLEVDIAESGNDGDGVNSNSDTFFDEIIQVTNQGKEEAEICFDLGGLTLNDSEAQVVFYTGTAQGSDGTDGDYMDRTCDADNPIVLETGHDAQVGIHVNTEDVDAAALVGSDDPLVEGYVTVLADVDDADGV